MNEQITDLKERLRFEVIYLHFLCFIYIYLILSLSSVCWGEGGKVKG